MLRCGPFAVGLPQLHDPHLASTATSTRKSSRLPELFIKTADTNNQLTRGQIFTFGISMPKYVDERSLYSGNIKCKDLTPFFLLSLDIAI
jgi:hypothetical protein